MKKAHRSIVPCSNRDFGMMCVITNSCIDALVPNQWRQFLSSGDREEARLHLYNLEQYLGCPARLPPILLNSSEFVCILTVQTYLRSHFTCSDAFSVSFYTLYTYHTITGYTDKLPQHWYHHHSLYPRCIPYQLQKPSLTIPQNITQRYHHIIPRLVNFAWLNSYWGVQLEIPF